MNHWIGLVLAAAMAAFGGLLDMMMVVRRIIGQPLALKIIRLVGSYRRAPQ